MKRILVLTVFAAFLAVPAAAGATVTCHYESSAEILDVTMSGDGDTAEFQVVSGEIVVHSHGPVVACSNGPSTLANTDFIDVFEEGEDDSISIFQPTAFSATNFLLAIAKTRDEISLGETEGNDHVILGEGGVDFDADGSADITYLGGKPELVEVAGLGGSDTVSGRGGSGTGAAVSSYNLHLTGGAGGNDTLEGGEGTDFLEVGEGEDVARGFGGTDFILVHGKGKHTLDGGEGVDALSYEFAQGVKVDLGNAGPQSTGQGEETFSGIENISGSEADDTLIGDSGSNNLNGGFGDDTIEGGGGTDTLSGSIGADTASYANASAGVEVDLAAGTATGGAGKDSLSQFENLVGSAHADTLSATDGPNAIDPGAGKDLVKALGGDDVIGARDGAADDVSCGSGLDKAVADRLSLDTIHPDCETVDALPEAGGGGGGGKLDFRLSAARKQKVLRQQGVKVRVRCPVELCSVVAKVKGTSPKLGSKAAHKTVLAGPARTLKLPLGKKALTALRLALAAGRTPKLKVTATATAGSAAPVRRSVTVKVRR